MGQAPARVPLAARLRVDGVPTEPLRAYTRPAFRRTATGWERDGNQLLYYYDASIVAPRMDGRPHQLAVDVWDREALPTRFDFEPRGGGPARARDHRMAARSGSRQLAEESTRARSSRTIALALGRMLDSAATDATRAGIRAASWASSDHDELAASGVVARLVTAEALLWQREPALAQGVVAGVVREHPCLVPPTGSSPQLVELARSNRRAARCEPVSPLKVLTLGIVPGMGSLTVNDRRGAAVGAGLVAVALGRAFMLNQQAKQRYSEYLASTETGGARTLYQSVSELRDERTIAPPLLVAYGSSKRCGLRMARSCTTRRIADDRF